MNDSTRNTRTVASTFLDALLARGIEHVFANAGTDFAPVIEAMVCASDRKQPMPAFHTIPHENVAVAMAHGYYLVTGKPAAAMVHVTVGTANALCSLMNASRDNAPVLLMAGHTPNTESGLPGSRSAGIHWGQDSFDQGGMVREYVKWDYELRSGQSVDSVVGRALDIAMTEPRGPVYLHMPREVLGEAERYTVPPPRQRKLGATPAEPAAEAITEAALMLAQAEFPLLLTASAGREPGNVQLLTRLADEFGVAIAYQGEPGARDVAIASDHPMNLGLHPKDAIAKADVILAIDCEVPWWPRMVSPRTDAKLIHVAPDPFFSRYPLRGFEMDLAIAGSSSAALRMLCDSLNGIAGKHRSRIGKRRDEITAIGRERQRQIEESMKESSGRRPIHPFWVAACLNRVKERDAIIVNELGVPMQYLELTEPRTYLTSSLAGGLGFGMGAALGARLGAPDRQVILLVGDGSYMFGNPVSAHFVACSEGLPTLTIVMNNGRWHAVNRSTVGMYPDGRAAAAEMMPLVKLGPSPEYDQIIKACGGYGERVDDPAQLEAAMRRALDAVRKGQAALLNVITQPLNY